MDKYVEQFVTLLIDGAVVILVIFAGYLLVRFVLVKLFQRLLRRYGIDEVFIRFTSLTFVWVMMTGCVVRRAGTRSEDDSSILEGLAHK